MAQHHRPLLINEGETRHQAVVQRLPIPRISAAEVDAKLLSFAVCLCCEEASLEIDRVIFPGCPSFGQRPSVFRQIDLGWALYRSAWSTTDWSSAESQRTYLIPPRGVYKVEHDAGFL